MKRIHPSLLALTVLTSLLLPACSGSGGHDGGMDAIYSADTDGQPFESADLALLELRHRVKRVTKTTYYNVTPGPDSVAIDTAAVNRFETIVYFDSLGNYVPRRDERIVRDELGRMKRWEDHRPNLRRLHGGYLKDTLSYTHLSPNVIQSDGMGDFAVTVYDDRRRIVGQYTDPHVDGDHTAVFNIYRAEDPHGNWTERLSVWTTQSAGSRPHVSYTLDRRDITYYR
ncbi:MAG: hypothetical protein HFJ91_08185 [Muribaculaceae bacterium]|nr:hypothetical protein [Muribaculaceae bacterium]